MRTKTWIARGALGLALAAVMLAPWLAPDWTAEAANLTVTKTADTNDGTCDSDCSLREAINAASSGDTVIVPAGTYGIGIAGAGEDAGATGDLDVDVNLTIQGAGAGSTTIDGNDYDRVLHAIGGVSLSLEGLTVIEGTVVGSGGGILATGALSLDDVAVGWNVASEGGGIRVFGDLTMLDSAVAENQSTGQGGGINAGSTFTITNSTVGLNIGGGQGAGIFVNVGSGVTVAYTFQNADVSGNTGSGQGGGFFFNGNNNTTATVTIEDSVFDNNSAGNGDGGGMFWNVNSGGTTAISISSSAFTRNDTNDDGGGINLNSGGGTDSISITNTSITGNQSSGDGGGLSAWEFAVSINGSTLENNTALGANSRGGAIDTGETLQLTDTTVNGNSAGRGGGIYFNGTTATISGSTISNNTATGSEEYDGGGGGIYNDATMQLVNSTLSGNTAAFGGGGILNDNVMEIIHGTIAGNTAGSYGDQIYNSNSLDVKNTIISGSATNCSGGDEGGPNITSSGNNIDSGTSCELNDVGDLSNTDPQIGALASNGGPTQTRALLAGSPAIDAADGGWCPADDQRGVARPVGPQCDIGAFEGESEGEPDPTATATSIATATRTATPTPDNTSVAGGSGGAGNLDDFDGDGLLSTATPQSSPTDVPSPPTAVSATTLGTGAAPILAPNTGGGPDDNGARVWWSLIAALASLSAVAFGAARVIAMSRGRR